MGKNSVTVSRQKNDSVPMNPFETYFFRVTWLLFGVGGFGPWGFDRVQILLKLWQLSSIPGNLSDCQEV